MSFPIPPDVRAARNFELVLGQEDMLRHDYTINTGVTSFEVGELVKLVTGGGEPKAAKMDSGDAVATPPAGARFCWTLFKTGDSNLGQSDVLATNKVTLLSGKFQAKTKNFLAGTYTPGFLLVAAWDSVNSRGSLQAVDPTSASSRQIASAVGRVLDSASGVLYFETL